mgnify:CR=1 FL=1
MKVKRLVEILTTMDVPKFRQELTPSNVRWLLRNLRARNGQHPDINETISGLKEVTRANR